MDGKVVEGGISEIGSIEPEDKWYEGGWSPETYKRDGSYKREEGKWTKWEYEPLALSKLGSTGTTQFGNDTRVSWSVEKNQREQCQR